MTANEIAQKFQLLYHTKPLLVRSPGRINLIGEHTDYNDGFVMPAAIDRATFFAISGADDGVTEIYSMMYDETFVADIHHPEKVDSPKWVNYLLGVVHQFVSNGYSLKPFKCVFGGNIPVGAGLSSSASVECGLAFALNELNQHHIPKLSLVKMAQWAEHNFAGVQCGIMDQFASMMGAEDNVIVLDCRSLEFNYSPLRLTHHSIVLCDSKVKHSLVESEYNTRRKECEEGVRIVQKTYPHVNTLRDVSEDVLLKHRHEMNEKVFNRCLYVVQEIKRVQEASEDLKANHLKAFGKKMFETHEGLSGLYEVSCKELNFLVEKAKDFKTILGARMMGGGFGGCTINLVNKDEVSLFIREISKTYRAKFGHDMEAYVVNIEDGTSQLIPDTGF